MTDTLSGAQLVNQTSRRRRMLLGAVAAMAAVAGASLAWRINKPQLPFAGVEAELWNQVLVTPEDGLLRVDLLRGQPLLVNFWAPWCAPCVEELPLLSRFYDENARRGWQVLGLALDQMAPVKQFLVANPVSFPVALAGGTGLELGRVLGNASGALPFTVVLNPAGRLVHRKIGRLTHGDLRDWAAQL